MADKAVYLVFGGDEFLVSTSARELAAQLAPADSEIELETVNGRASNADEVSQALQQVSGSLYQVSLFSGEKLVWLKDATFFSGGGAGRSAAAKDGVKKLTELLKKGLPAGHSLLISAEAVDKRSGFYKFAKSKGELQEFAKSDKSWEWEEQAKEHARHFLKMHGLSGTQRALDYFVSRTGSDTRRIAMEAEKLALYLGEEKTIQEEDVRAVVSATSESAVWDLTDAIGKGQLSLALSKLHELIGQRESPVRLVMELSRRFRELLIYRECLDRGWLRVGAGRSNRPQWQEGPEIDEALSGLDKDPRKLHPFRAGQLINQARGYSLGALEQSKRAIGDCHEQLVSIAVPGPILLEHLLLKIFHIKQEV